MLLKIIAYTIMIILFYFEPLFAQGMQGHGGLNIGKQRCLICHGSLPPDKNHPVYKGCRLWSYCSVCHGKGHGRGDGPASEFLFPKPRDFNRGIFKYKSTPPGKSPTEKDIFNVVSRGIPGSAMPSFAFLREEERWALVDHVKTLGRIFDTEKAMDIPDPPEFTPDLIKRGKELYEKLNCLECHGKTGKGDGPKSGKLMDEWGFPVYPPDLTSGIYKGGGAPKELYLRITAGIDGTPMPSYRETTTPFERWALVAYIKSIANKARHFDNVIKAKYVKNLPIGFSPEWEKIPKHTIPISPLWQMKEEMRLLDVRAVYDGTSIAIYLEWEGKRGIFPTACAVQFPTTAFIPTIVMGQRGYPVKILYWKEGDHVEEIMAEGIGTITPVKNKQVKGKGIWRNGRWSVLFIRKFSNKKIPVAFALWDGDKKERGGQKGVSTWNWLILEKK